jgi:hypothetical protein
MAFTDDLMAALRDMRGIDEGDECEMCQGWGVIAYGTTATWRGGGGGATPTSGVCNKCWGSGKQSYAWPRHPR